MDKIPGIFPIDVVNNKQLKKEHIADTTKYPAHDFEIINTKIGALC